MLLKKRIVKIDSSKGVNKYCVICEIDKCINNRFHNDILEHLIKNIPNSSYIQIYYSATKEISEELDLFNLNHNKKNEKINEVIKNMSIEFKENADPFYVKVFLTITTEYEEDVEKINFLIKDYENKEYVLDNIINYDKGLENVDYVLSKTWNHIEFDLTEDDEKIKNIDFNKAIKKYLDDDFLLCFTFKQKTIKELWIKKEKEKISNFFSFFDKDKDSFLNTLIKSENNFRQLYDVEFNLFTTSNISNGKGFVRSSFISSDIKHIKENVSSKEMVSRLPIGFNIEEYEKRMKNKKNLLSTRQILQFSDFIFDTNNNKKQENLLLLNEHKISELKLGDVYDNNHCLIVGCGGCGLTTLKKTIALEKYSKGEQVIVFARNGELNKFAELCDAQIINVVNKDGTLNFNINPLGMFANVEAIKSSSEENYEKIFFSDKMYPFLRDFIFSLMINRIYDKNDSEYRNYYYGITNKIGFIFKEAYDLYGVYLDIKNITELFEKKYPECEKEINNLKLYCDNGKYCDLFNKNKEKISFEKDMVIINFDTYLLDDISKELTISSFIISMVNNFLLNKNKETTNVLFNEVSFSKAIENKRLITGSNHILENFLKVSRMANSYVYIISESFSDFENQNKFGIEKEKFSDFGRILVENVNNYIIMKLCESDLSRFQSYFDLDDKEFELIKNRYNGLHPFTCKGLFSSFLLKNNEGDYFSMQKLYASSIF
jgi:hypothetical protein